MIEPIARVRIELREIEPTRWRRFDGPLTSTLLALHDIIDERYVRMALTTIANRRRGALMRHRANVRRLRK